MSKPEQVEWKLNGAGALTAYINGVPAVWFPQPGSQEAFLQCPVFEALLAGNRAGGKALRNDQRILTDLGWKQVGDVTMSNKLVATDGTYTEIDGIFPQGKRELYKLTFYDDVEIVADAEHLWEVRHNEPGWKTKTTKEMMNGNRRWYVPLLESPAPGKQWTGPNPYILGLLLGDGCLTGWYTELYAADEYIRDYAISGGFLEDGYKKSVWRLGFRGEQYRDVLGRNSKEAKHIPQELLEADPYTRLRLLQGIMDSDGTIGKSGCCEICTISKALADGYIYLIRSLGGMAKKRLCPPNGYGKKDFWRIRVYHVNKFNPFALPRKRDRIRTIKHHTHRRIKSIEPCGVGDATCFAVKHPRKLFIIDGFVVTHNTDCLLMDFAQQVGKGYGSEWKGILFRRTFPELDDIIGKSLKWFKKIWPNANFNKATKTWEWATGETLKFRHIARPQEYYNYHGHSYPWIGFEELTTWPNPDCYTPLFSLSRSSHIVVAKLCRIRATTNPYGVGHSWVKKRFRLPMAEDMLIGNVIKDTRTDIPEDEREQPRVAIRSSLAENKIMLLAQPNYIQTLRAAARNPAELAAWIDGSWDIKSGGMFDDIYDESTHVVPDIPYFLLRKSGWFMNRAYDHGLSKPFAVGWWAESNGNPITMFGREYGAIKGDLFLFNEYYGCTGEENKGLNMSAREIAQQIKYQEKEMGLRGRIKRGPADSAIFSKYDGSKTHAGDMKKEGVYWDAVDKSPGSRPQGWQQMRSLLKGALPVDGLREYKGMFVCERCLDWRRTVPNLSRDDKNLDDVNTDVEDHAGDMTRYRLRWTRKTITQRKW